MLGNILILVRITNEDMHIEQVSRQMNLNIKTIRSIENGIKKLSLTTLEQFSKIYQIPLSQLLMIYKSMKKLTDRQILRQINDYYESQIIESLNVKIK